MTHSHAGERSRLGPMHHWTYKGAAEDKRSFFRGLLREMGNPSCASHI